MQDAPTTSIALIRATMGEFATWTEAIWTKPQFPAVDPNIASELVMVMGLSGETAEVLEELLTVVAGYAENDSILVKEMGDALYCWALTAHTYGFDTGELFTREPAELREKDLPEHIVLGLVISAGHALETVKKYLRDGSLNRAKLEAALVTYAKAWRLLCMSLGLTIESVMAVNREKLEDRIRRGTLGGSGNNR